MRQSVAFSDAPLGSTQAKVALVYAATIPSGDAEIVRLRNLLMNLTFGPGFVETQVTRDGLKSPTIVHGCFTEFIETADDIFVGRGTDAFSLTPWSCPFAPENHSVAQARYFFPPPT